MSQPPDKPKNETTWTDGGPTPGGPQDKSFAYRQSRKAFIASCEKAGADVIGRVYPAKGPDGLPLFLDAAAFGPRLATAGILVVGYGIPASVVMMTLLADRKAMTLAPDVRLVLVHGANPAVIAFNDPARDDPIWSAKMLAAVVTEDLRKAQRLTVIGLGGPAQFPVPAGMALTHSVVAPDGAAKVALVAAIRAAG
jgi:hypothetical protein